MSVTEKSEENIGRVHPTMARKKDHFLRYMYKDDRRRYSRFSAIKCTEILSVIRTEAHQVTFSSQKFPHVDLSTKENENWNKIKYSVSLIFS